MKNSKNIWFDFTGFSYFLRLITKFRSSKRINVDSNFANIFFKSKDSFRYEQLNKQLDVHILWWRILPDRQWQPYKRPLARIIIFFDFYDNLNRNVRISLSLSLSPYDNNSIEKKIREEIVLILMRGFERSLLRISQNQWSTLCKYRL